MQSKIIAVLMAGACTLAFSSDAFAASKSKRAMSRDAQRASVTVNPYQAQRYPTQAYQSGPFGTYNAASGYNNGYAVAGPVGGVVGGAVGLGLGIATAPLNIVGNAFTGGYDNAYGYNGAYSRYDDAYAQADDYYTQSGVRPLGANASPYSYGADRANPSSSWTGYDFNNPRDRQLVGSR